ncbi:MAG: type II toxin-antitoxin system RelE/ParE family toxin [Bacteroidetes bacterium]|nr:type II toxin-antitoxin system RelE/ParE family toxin [Bacteroidota bacterium]
MRTIFKNSFLKEIRKVKDQKLKNDIADTIELVEKVDSISKIPHIKKMQGYKTYYRIRIGNYRVGVRIERNTVTFSAFDHRKDIYKRFP